MGARESTAWKRVWEELRASGVLLVSDAELPSVAGLVAEAPLRGSWWAHPQSHAIFRVATRLASRPDILAARLISGKVTFVHRRLWSTLSAVATARERWQMQGLSPLARSLLSRLTQRGVLRTDELAAAGKANAKALGEAARELERKLLVHSESISYRKWSALQTDRELGAFFPARASGAASKRPNRQKNSLKTSRQISKRGAACRSGCRGRAGDRKQAGADGGQAWEPEHSARTRLFR